MCGPAAFMMVGSGLMSAKSSIDAGNANAAAQDFNAREMGKQIEVAKLQAIDEENQRREYSLNQRSANLAAAAASGVMSDSESFQAIDRANRRKSRRDQGLIRVNRSNRVGQMAGQQHQYQKAAHAQRKSGKIGALGSMFNMGTDLYLNSPNIGGT